jgi:hypothetical protein
MCDGHACSQRHELTHTHHFRVEIFHATLDTQLFGLNRVFSEKVMDLLFTSVTLIFITKFRGFKASEI